MANKNDPFQRSTQTHRSPPQRQNDSTVVDPNASSCPLCEDKDSEDMVECEKCKNWYHFQCVGVDASIASVNWNCNNCSTRANPSNSNCPSCFREDSILMIQCIKCKDLFHFGCAGVDTSMDTTVWNCQKCSTKLSVEHKSVRSSTSSKRRSALQLEKLQKEKAIQTKLIEEKLKLFEQQATVDAEFLQKEYEIRNQVDSEDDEVTVAENTNKGKYVTDWVNSTNPELKRVDFSQQMKTINEELLKEARDRILSHPISAEIRNQELQLIPPKQVQFAQPLDHEFINSTIRVNNEQREIGLNPVSYPSEPTFDQQEMDPSVMQHQYEYEMNDVNIQPTELADIEVQIVDIGKSTEFNPPPFASKFTDLMNRRSLNPIPIVPTPAQESTHVPTSAHHRKSETTFSQLRQQMSTQRNVQQAVSGSNSTQQQTFVPIMAQHQLSMPIPVLRPPSVSTSTQQPQFVPTTVQHSSTPIWPQQQTIAPNTVHQQQPLVSVSNWQQLPFVSTSAQQFGMNPNIHQPVIPTSTIQPQQFMSNLYQQQSIPVMSTIQQPIVSSMTSHPQFVNYAQQSMFGPSVVTQAPLPINSNIGFLNTGSNPTGFSRNPQVILNQGLTYDPQLNPQQLPPSRLQLAARQTMPRDYPKFKGDPERWSIFYNAYVNCTTTCGLSNGENLSRLEKCLEEPARKSVNYLLTRPESVPEIIDTLRILYGRPEASIEAQLQAIRNEAAPKMNKMETFINFSMSIRNVTSEIEKTGMWQYLWDPKLIHELVEKLPYQMQMEWGQIIMTTPNANLSYFSQWLFMRARTACAVTFPSSIEKKAESNDKTNSKGHVNSHSKSSNSNKNNSSDNSDVKICHACNGRKHDIYECRKFQGMSLNDKWETVKNHKLCRICLGRHHVLQCESKSLCGESGCTVKHHRLLHNPQKIDQAVTTTTNNSSTNEGVHSAHQQSKSVILRRYIPVTLYGPNGSINVIAFLDDGSDMTLIESQVVKKLGITGIPTDLFLEWTAKIVRKEPNSRSISLKISGAQTQHKQYEITDVRTVKSLDLPPQTVDIKHLKDAYPFLRRIPIDGYNNETPKILIGLRDCKLTTPRKVRSGHLDEPMAAKTLLGWEVHGANAVSAKIVRVNSHTEEEMNEDDKLHKMVAQFFSLENFGVKKPEQTVEAISDKRARYLLESTTKRIGDKFETGLLWKYDDVLLPDSLPMAKRRLISLEKRLEKAPSLDSSFRTKFYEYVEKGYVRKLTMEEETERNDRTWYLPLFPVTYAKKPGKIRLVWDAAAKVSNISLNSMLLSGPDLLVALPGVLYRFRQGAYVVTGDIREMFHQIAIRKEDQTALRFLWREKGSTKIDTYVLQVMSFGATCSPSSAQYVKNLNATQFTNKSPKAEKAIRTNTYVDDWLQAFDTEEEAERIAKEVKEVYSKGGFEIRNWLSNSSRVRQSLGMSCDNEQNLSFDVDESQTERILGMWWAVKQDVFTYSLRYNPLNKDVLTGQRPPTKREALRTLMSIYDPLGFLASFLVQLKMILQDIWRTGIGWDQRINLNDEDNIYNRWLNWIKYLPDIEQVHLNRHYSSKINATNAPKIELHIFVDASELAYATVAYFRIEDQDGVECSLIGGKTKVAPLKPLSVPRMELQAAVLGTRFRSSILENHTVNISRIVMWSDSFTVLSWLKSDLRKYGQFVGARVGEILENTVTTDWRWVPSKLNPADDATKFKNSFNLDMNSRWFTGPDFLRQPEEYWPKMSGTIEETEEELKPKYLHVHTKREVEPLPIKFEEVSKWIRTMAFALRFVNNIKAKLGKPGSNAQTGLLGRSELQDGENALYRKAQMDEFTPEIKQLQKGPTSNNRRTSVERTSQLYRYSPYLDHAGVLRMRGRIDVVSNVSTDQKRPIILPTKNQITELIVKEYHVRYKHQNTETVINEIKQKFIIPRLRALFKRIRRTCQHCKNVYAQPKPPEMAPLPIGRLASFTKQFTYVGLDYAGPYKITQFKKSVKMWIVIFTCLTIRGVYIDCVESLTTDSCIMAINRFNARMGTPREFFSDRGTNFVGANNELAREVEKIDHDLLKEKFTTCYTQWNFNPPYAQYMGGAWERLIGSMKKTLDKILPKSHYPNHETFVTALSEVENIINSRPLTFVSIEPEDQEALTPNHFMKGSSNGNKPPGIFPPLPATLRGNWRYAQQIANEFWNKWVKEYLPMITRRTKWFDDVKPIEVGDQVIIVDENAPRNMWDRGVVIEALESGTNGRISRVKVRTTDGIYTRPVSKLAVLDLQEPSAKTPTRETLAEGSVTARNEI